MAEGAKVIFADQQSELWVEVKDFRINIRKTDEGVVVDIWGKSEDEPIAGAYAFDAEVIDFSCECPKCGGGPIYQDRVDQKNKVAHCDACGEELTEEEYRQIKDNYCPKCGCNWMAHNDDGSCVKES